MKSAVDQLLRDVPGLDPQCARGFAASLSDEYFRAFDSPTRGRQIRLVADLTPETPCRAYCEKLPDGPVRVTIAAFDAPGELSWITGLIAALGAGIRAGDVFTLASRGEVVSSAPIGPARARSRVRRRRPDRNRTDLHSRRILDIFELVDLPESPQQWVQTLEQGLSHCLHLYRNGGENTARSWVAALIAERLLSRRTPPAAVLLPLQIEITPAPDRGATRFDIRGQDTPAFLYCLSNALAVNRIYIDGVRIRTFGDQVADSFRVKDAAGNPLASKEEKDRLRLAVLVTKQFSHFLGSAADPLKALTHFNDLLGRLPSDAEAARQTLRDPDILRDLARLLGASDYLWEDFIRLQYENLIPLLKKSGERCRPASRDTYGRHLRDAVEPLQSWEERVRVLNDYKDRELVKLDVSHILDMNLDMDTLSAALTDLAEAVIQTALDIGFRELRKRYGLPRNIAGRVCPFTVMGLGKLGGGELGYASDLEMFCVYADSGVTDGPDSIPAAEFADRLAECLRDAIRARREGIFETDFRLRPHGAHGPLACSLETFCRYYAGGGDALDYERQALIKMRCVAGDRALGRRVEAFRDEILFHARTVQYEAIDSLRRRQHRELTAGNRLNAKYSAGGLVDIEYAVQYLQVLHGHIAIELRSPNTQAALHALGRQGLLPNDECENLLTAYRFLRNLINALRILRGHARDLEVPAVDSVEFGHLARRMGYTPHTGHSAAERLRIDLGAHMAYTRDFCRRRFGRSLLATRETGNLADVALARDMDTETIRGILGRTGFRDPDRAALNLRRLAEASPDRDVFCQVVVLAEPLLRNSADCDMALNNWERILHTVISPRAFLESLRREPQQMEIFLDILAASQFLADVLTRNPESLPWVVSPEQLLHEKDRSTFLREIRDETVGLTRHEHVLNALRRARRRHILRIGTRDLCLDAPFENTVSELSWLADALIRQVFEAESTRIPRARKMLLDRRLTVLALGKLGGGELNYSSDVDLLFYLPAPEPDELEATAKFCRQVLRSLSTSTPDGYLYRVDMRLRPFGRGGELMGTGAGLLQYYEHGPARPMEIQALLKARPILGDEQDARKLIGELVHAGVERYSFTDFAAEAKHLRGRAQARKRNGRDEQSQRVDVKNGPGGIRDIEFSIQLLQLRFLEETPALRTPNTIEALHRLVECDRLSLETANRIRDRYTLLRRVEHLLQIMDDRQIHELSTTPESLRALAKRLRRRDPDPETLRTDLLSAHENNLDLFARVCDGQMPI